MGNLDDKKGSGEFGSFELTKEMMQDIYDQDHREGLSREEYAALVREVNGGAARARFNNELEKFLENNALASEKDFIDYAIDDTDMRIDWYQKEVDFFDDPFDIDPDKRTYWFYRAYKDYLLDRLDMKRSEPDASFAESDFRAYLTDTGIKILQLLIKKYKDAKPKKLALMLHCLQDYGLLSNSIRSFNQDSLTLAIKGQFKKVKLSRQSLYYGIDRYETPDISERTELKEEKLIIHEMTKKNKLV